jgi:Flp pilus assembly protein TadD
MEQLNKKKIFKDADFWYHKGISSAKKGNTETAIECYKQALKLVRDETQVY